jgi:hypothetical protein
MSQNLSQKNVSKILGIVLRRFAASENPCTSEAAIIAHFGQEQGAALRPILTQGRTQRPALRMCPGTQRRYAPAVVEQRRPDIPQAVTLQNTPGASELVCAGQVRSMFRRGVKPVHILCPPPKITPVEAIPGAWQG